MSNDEEEAAQKIKERLSNFGWRIRNLYKIKDTDGLIIQFNPNWAQLDFLGSMHYCNVILKARQLGFSTLIGIYFLDAAIFHRNHSCGIIAQGDKEAKKLLDNVRFTYNQLPAWLKSEVRLVTDNEGELEFSNGSKIVSGISLRSGTYQKLHVSEYGKTSAKFPDKAREIKTGALNTVHAGNQVFVESTAEGQGGEFYEMVKIARQLADKGATLTPLDFKFHFYAWWQNPSYRLSDVEALGVLIEEEQRRYFESLDFEYGIKLSANQKAWYVKKALSQGEDMWREFPSTPDEAFASSISGSIYFKEMRFLRKNKRICRVPFDPSFQVSTYWDLGSFNYLSIWFHQRVVRERRMIRFYQDRQADLRAYVEYLKDTGYNYSEHVLPHDGNTVRLSEQNKSIKQMLEGLGLTRIRIVPVTRDKRRDIETIVKPELMQCYIDEENCSDGIKCLDNYKKKWDEQRGIFLQEPLHDEFSDGADAFRTYAMGYKEQAVKKPTSMAMPAGQAPP